MTHTRSAYRVRRSGRARRSRLTISREGEVVVVLPSRAPEAEARRLLTTHAAWLERHLGRIARERERLAARPALGEGRLLQVSGEPTRVIAIDAGAARPARSRVQPVDGELRLHRGRDGRGDAEVLEAWLRTRARDAIGQQVAWRSEQMGVRPARIAIRDQSTRWASASARGTLSFSWRLLLTPPWVLDAVVVHELVHLRIRGHPPRFWALVHSHAPRTPEARRWLREHAADLRSALA